LNLWRDYKTNRYHDVEYKEKARLNNYNYEVETQLDGKSITYEKVIQGHKTNIKNQEIKAEDDSNQMIMKGIENPV